ncbi:MAG: hypothetical protein PHI59_07960 [Candidatus Omnitrophica bacterium]|nr:hypothetical protein [Candidatus Omnitrophota bacterium]
MKKNYSYVREKLFDGVYLLAVGQKDVRRRLIRAYLACHTLRAKDFPEEFRKDWEWIEKQLTKYGPVLNHKGEVWIGSVENTMTIIKNKTGSKIAKKIFDLYCAMHKDRYV